VKKVASKIATIFEYDEYDYKIVGHQDDEKFSDGKFFLTEETLRSLKNLNEREKFLNIGSSSIKTLNYVGVVSVGSFLLEIFPKFYKKRGIEFQSQRDKIAYNLLKMLTFSERLPFRVREVDIADLAISESPFFEIFIQLFAKNLLKLLKSKQNFEYVRREDELKFFRGKIDIKKYSNPTKLHIIPCIFHERCMDNLINRTLKYTSYLMLRIVNNYDNFRLLKEIISILDSVPIVPIKLQEVESITFNRLNVDFKPFIDICKVFLRNATLTLQASKLETFSLLIPMEILFEDFITGVIKKNKILGGEAIVKPQESLGYLARREEDKRGVFKLVPDILVTVGSKKFIVDAKYKILEPNDEKLGVSQQDIYQMYAYATKSDAEKVLLVYPDLESELKSEWYFEQSNGRKIGLFVRTLNLSYDLRGEWNRFVEELKEVLECLNIKKREVRI
jgi:5-methylcytosine-specific restriction enzyme subunit McrC